jgi:hypothetical protein
MGAQKEVGGIITGTITVISPFNGKCPNITAQAFLKFKNPNT